MAMAGGTVSGLFDLTTFSSSSPTAADQHSPAAFKRSQEVFSWYGTGAALFFFYLSLAQP
jgi:hypothetical protein